MNQRTRATVVRHFLADGIFPVVVGGLLLPVGLLALLLTAGDIPVEGAIERGELFLCAGSAGFVGALVFSQIEARGRAREHRDASLVVLAVAVLWVLPCYAAWAFISVRALEGSDYSERFAEFGGAVAAGLGILMALCMILIASFRTTAERAGP